MYILFAEEPSGRHILTRTMFKTIQGACNFLNTTNREEICGAREAVGGELRPQDFKPHYAGEGYQTAPLASRNARVVLVRLEEERKG